MDLSVQNKLEPRKGRFLLAEPFLQEQHFHRSVVYLCDHNEEGSFGFVLNKYLEISPTELVEKIPNKDLQISIGGPVDDSSLFYLHKSGDLIENAIPIADDIFIGGSFETVAELLTSGKINENEISFFLGYSGWSENQLNQEIESKSWLVAESADPAKYIFGKDKDLWKNLMAEQGRRHEILSKFPDNHLWN
ncbi:MAG: YqgE/AlgH family protein [Crocinitomicaceae bacterium]|nr:YqgE/AlgH family protein [Crocinitomicaceae bacterium]